MSKQNHIEVVVDGIRCYWQVVASFGEHGEKKLLCSRYPHCDFPGEYNKKVVKHVSVPRPSHTMAEDGAIAFIAEEFGFDEDEANEIRKLIEDIKWKKSAYTMLQNLAEADKA